MALTPYCTNDEVRAVLGVTTSELKDEVLDLPVYEIGLRRELNKVSLSLPASFSAVLAITGTLTDAQQSLLESTKLFSVYAAAKQAGAPLAMSAPKSLNDDKSGFSRYADSPYKDVLDRIDSAYLQARQEVTDALAEYLGSSSNGFSGMPFGLAVSSRVYDPVVGS